MRRLSGTNLPFNLKQFRKRHLNLMYLSLFSLKLCLFCTLKRSDNGYLSAKAVIVVSFAFILCIYKTDRENLKPSGAKTFQRRCLSLRVSTVR